MSPVRAKKRQKRVTQYIVWRRGLPWVWKLTRNGWTCKPEAR